MHVLRVVRVLLLVLVAAVVVGAASSVLSARPDLQNAKRDVDTSWSALSGQLSQRYLLLADANQKLQPIPGPIRGLVGDVGAALTNWRDAKEHGAVAAQVKAANNVEGLARRLVATAAVSPRVKSNPDAQKALVKFIGDGSRAGASAGDFNKSVETYEHERRGPVRAVVASVLGDGTIPALDTTETSVSAS
jgi:hypothetical protein